jgi:hypothetical protein
MPQTSEDHSREASTIRPLRGMLLKMAISLFVIVIIWVLVLLELRSSMS